MRWPFPRLPPAPARSEGWFVIDLPADGAIRKIRMSSSGRPDQVAQRAAATGWQSFEPPMPALFRAFARTARGLIVDAGANTGFYALLGAAASREVRVAAFEPDPGVRELLEHNVSANGQLCSRIDLAGCALSEREGVAALYLPDPKHGLVETSASLESGFKSVHGGVHQVPVTTLDAWLRHHAPEPPVALIKVDVEGHEAPLLAGADETVRRWRPPLFVEILPMADRARLASLLDGWGYVTVPLRPGAVLEPQDRPTYVPDAPNHLWLPLEKLGLLRALS